MSAEIETDFLATHLDNQATLRQLAHLRNWQMRRLISEKGDLTSLLPEENFLDIKRLDPNLEEPILGMI